MGVRTYNCVPSIERERTITFVCLARSCPPNLDLPDSKQCHAFQYHINFIFISLTHGQIFELILSCSNVPIPFYFAYMWLFWAKVSGCLWIKFCQSFVLCCCCHSHPNLVSNSVKQHCFLNLAAICKNDPLSNAKWWKICRWCTFDCKYITSSCWINSEPLPSDRFQN